MADDPEPMDIDGPSMYEAVPVEPPPNADTLAGYRTIPRFVELQQRRQLLQFMTGRKVPQPSSWVSPRKRSYEEFAQDGYASSSPTSLCEHLTDMTTELQKTKTVSTPPHKTNPSAVSRAILPSSFTKAKTGSAVGSSKPLNRAF